MLINLRIGNFKVFDGNINLSFEANGYIKRFDKNITRIQDKEILKASCIYGPNNVGKSCVVEAISCLRNIMYGYGVPSSIGQIKNFFTSDEEISLGMTLTYKDDIYSFDTRFLEWSSKYPHGRFTYERFSKIDRESGKDTIIYLRDTSGKSHFSASKKISGQMDLLPRHNLFPYQYDKGVYPEIDECVSLIKEIALSILIFIPSSNSPVKTINELKSDNKDNIRFIKDLIRDIDVGIDDFYYEKNENNPVYSTLIKMQDPSASASFKDMLYDQCSLYSVHGGKKVESIAYDSNGTKEIISLAGYIVDALTSNKTLVIDEFDNGLHERVIREIVGMFNSSLNRSSQLIYTIQNSTLIDTKTLFRKDQIWFVHKEEKRGKNSPELYVYRLSEFTSKNSGVRQESDVFTKYRDGLFGAVPEPSLFNLMKDMSEYTHGS